MRTLPILLILSMGMGAATLLKAQQSDPPLTLDTAIRLALERNRDIKVEAFVPAIARANLLTAVGQFDPALAFNLSNTSSSFPGAADPLVADQTKTNNYSLALQGLLPWGLNYNVGARVENSPSTSNNFTDQYVTFDGITLTQPLLQGFGFGANLVHVRVAKANRAISDWDYRQTLITTVTNVVIAYSNLILAHDELRIAQGSRDLAATLLSQNKQELKAGNGAQSDVTAANAQVAEREEAILLAGNAVRSADNQLRELMGETSFPPGQPLLVVTAPAVPYVTVDPAKDLQVALTERPDYQAARMGITINRAMNAAARNQLLPQVNLVASYGYNGLGNSFAASRRVADNGDFPASSIGISVSLPITNAQGRGQARAARLQLQQSQVALRGLEANIALSVANAAAEIETARKRVVADRAAYQLASQSLADEEKKLRAGTSSTLSVIQAQQILISIENSVANALAAERVAVAAYDQQLGTTLIRHHIDPTGR